MWPFNRKERDPRYNHELTEADRELSINTRKLKAKERELDYERRKLEHDVAMAELQDKLDQIQGTDEEETPQGNSIDTLLVSLLAPILMKGNAPGVPQSTSSTVQPPTREHLSDEALGEIYNQIPKAYRKMAKGMSDETLAGLIRGRMPNLDDDTIQRAIILARQ